MKSVKKSVKDKEAKVIQTVVVKVGEAKKKRKTKRRRMKAKSSSTTQPSGGISVAPQFPLQQASIIPPSSGTLPPTYPSLSLMPSRDYGAGDYRKMLEDILALSIQSGQQKALAIQQPLQPPIIIQPATTLSGTVAPPPTVPPTAPSVAPTEQGRIVSARGILSKSQTTELRDYLKTVLDLPPSDKKTVDSYMKMVLADNDKKQAFLIGVREGNLLRDEAGMLEDNAREYLIQVFGEEIAPV